MESSTYANLHGLLTFAPISMDLSACANLRGLVCTKLRGLQSSCTNRRGLKRLCQSSGTQAPVPIFGDSSTCANLSCRFYLEFCPRQKRGHLTLFAISSCQGIFKVCKNETRTFSHTVSYMASILQEQTKGSLLLEDSRKKKSCYFW